MSQVSSRALVTFFEEARELLVSLEAGLMGLEAGGADEAEVINAIFRAAHTIKGSAGLFGLEPIVRFAHAAETLLDQVRGRRVSLDRETIADLMAAKDHLEVLLHACERNEAVAPDPSLSARLLARATGAPLVPGASASPAPSMAPSAPAAASPRGGAVTAPAPRCYSVHAAFGPDVLKDGMDPLAFVRYFESRGIVHGVLADFSSLPSGDAFDPERCYLTLDLELETPLDLRAVEEVFDFVRDTSSIVVIERFGAARAAPAPVSLSPVSVSPSRPGGGTATPVPRPSSEVHGDSRTIKVQADKLDALVNLVGELVIAGATSAVLGAKTKDSTVIESLSALNQLVEAIRDSALGLRMVQIGDTFARYRRVVRDVSQQLGKRIELELRGGETELDKAMVERLADPLLHLVRNAMDHGLEAPEVRRARGKDEVGRLVLEAFHESGAIVIEVRDDGAGLNRQRILEKAVAQGLATPGQTLTDDEVTALIFRPGFSAAEAVTDLSGRGVGMDVVRRNIDELRGSVEVQSKEGQGTTVRLRLPLTLAIIDGFLVGVGRASYVVPMDLVSECVDLAPVLESAECHRLDLRGEVVPFIALRDLFRIPGAAPPRQSVVVVEYGGRRAGLVVDRLVGASQTVIKPLGPVFRKSKGIEGTTILGSGEVALILDIPQITRLAAQRATPTPSTAAA